MIVKRNVRENLESAGIRDEPGDGQGLSNDTALNAWYCESNQKQPRCGQRVRYDISTHCTKSEVNETARDLHLHGSSADEGIVNHAEAIREAAPFGL